jgi:hypothetical protein
MTRFSAPLLVTLIFTSFAAVARASSPAPAMPGSATTSSEQLPPNRPAPSLTLTQLQLQQYFYVDFPRQLQWLDNQTQLAEAELTLIARRVNGYRPFRSFHQYAATYTVDQEWQIALLAAQQRVECLRNARSDLWRQRQMVAAIYFSKGG